MSNAGLPNSQLTEFTQIIGYSFSSPSLLDLALTHPSYVREDPTAQNHYQRLEFLGDAVLQLVLTDQLYKKFPDAGEGPLTKARAQMVNRRTLAEQARRIRLGEFLFMSHGEVASGGRQRMSSLADSFEALIGAIFLDGGYEVAGRFILGQFRELFGELEVMPNLDNPKGELQELIQANSVVPPVYSVVGMMGPDHDRIFECVVLHEEVELGRGTGKSKKSAETEAALSALKRLKTKEEPTATPHASEGA